MKQNFNTFCFVHSFQPKVTPILVSFVEPNFDPFLVRTRNEQKQRELIEPGTSSALQEERHPSIEFLQI